MNPIDFFDAMPDIEFRASAAMRAVFRAAYGDPLDDEDRAQFHKLAGGRTAPADGAAEIEIVAGRGSTKTTVAGARFLVYEATQVPHEIALSPGQRGVLAIVSTEKTNQSAELLNAVKGLCQLDEIKPLVEGETENEVRFSTGVVIRKITADSKLLRGSRFVAAVIDEAAFLPWEGADPDTDIIRALRGGMTRIEGAPRRKLLAVSSAGPRKGWFYKNYEEHYGRNESPVLVFHGSTLDYNPATSREDLEAARARDPIGFQREYESQFIDVIADNWLGQSNIERCVDKGRTDAMPYELGLRYHIACDVGLEHDSTAIVVATSRWTWGDEQRSKQRRLTHVCYVERLTPAPGAPLNVREVLARVRRVCERYGTGTVYIDQFSSAVLIEMARSLGMKFVQVPWTSGGDDSKLQRFLRVREAMQDGSIRLPEDPVLLSELASIRGKALPSGGERLEASRGHDDVAHAAVMAASIALTKPPTWADDSLFPWEKAEKQAAIDRAVARLLAY